MHVSKGGDRLQALTPAGLERELTRILQADRDKVGRRRSLENWIVAVMVASSGVFAAALAAQVLRPAFAAVAGAAGASAEAR